MGEQLLLTDRGFDGHEEAAALQLRLHEHYLSLSTARVESGLPVFALEHGLSDGEVALLQRTVRWLVERRSTFRQTPLPLLVYAAEIGYRYDGGEIWPIFSEETPRWVDNSDTRARIKRYFIAFADAYSGAVPTGAWARKFSIICWPVVHAVLPKVFQRQLAEILYDNRYRLTSSVVEDSERLGKLIDAAAWGASDRFRNLTQNHSLIGQVATALLTADDAELAGDDSLLQSTVRRIVQDLSAERVAKRWLSAAQAATRTSFAGLRSNQNAPESGPRAQRSIDVVDPQLRLLRSMNGWRLIAELQDLSPLAERHPDLIEDLSRCRCRVNGSDRSLAPSSLLWPGQRTELNVPMTDEPFLQLIGASERSNGFISDHCTPPPLPWLFRVEDGEGTVVLGHFVRSGSEYVLVTPNLLPPIPGLIQDDSGSIPTLRYYRINVPHDVTNAVIDNLGSIEISIQTAIRVWPAGLANAGWNGADVAVWLEGDPIVFGVEADREVDHLIVSIDREAQRVALNEQSTFLDLGALPIGQHSVDFEAFAAGTAAPVAKGSIGLRIRPRSIRPRSGSLREGLVLLTSPGTVSLAELLSGDFDFEVLGPPGANITVRITLLHRRRELPIVEEVVSTTLPLRADTCRQIVSKVLRSERVSRQIEKCDLVKIAFGHRDLGVVEVIAGRTFTPLRWIVSHDNSSPSALLVDNMDGITPEVMFRPLSQPDRYSRIVHEEATAIELPESGLLTAKANDIAISTVVTPGRIRSLSELGARGREISLEHRSRTVESLRQLSELAMMWRSADKPDFNAALATRRVLQAITVEIAAGIGGTYWARVEHQRFDAGRVLGSQMRQALGATPHQKSVIDTLNRRLPAPAAMTLQELATTFSSIISWAESSSTGADVRLGEFCLRVASQPSSVAELNDALFSQHAAAMIEHPITIRLARFIVFQVDETKSADLQTDAPYEGFAWT